MATFGTGYDVSLKAGASVKTTTSEFLCVGAAATSTSLDRTCYVTNDSITAGTINASAFIGINQSGAMSSGSKSCDVRMHGISKGICSASITEWGWVEAYRGASTTTRRGQLQECVNGVSISVATASIASHRVIVGRALEAGSTNSVISIMVSPSLYDGNLIEA
ncbi:MAG: hypothetical protein GY853_02055 [PVC group bacterium]|nr:hypothetical protein [PVC group bacterium]